MTYEIKYAYPSSAMAKQLNKNATGCFYVELDGKDTGEPFQSIEEARTFALSTGYTPSPYSMDRV
jgi:hypothetical protein